MLDADVHGRSSIRWAALVVVALAVLANLSVLQSFFFADDFANLIELANVGPRDMLAAPAGGHLLVVRNAVTALLFAVFRMHAEAYFALALGTHAVNALLILVIGRRLTRHTLPAAFGAVLFAVAPTHDGTLGWHAAYGHALATSFTLLAVLLLLADDDEAPVSTPRAVAIWACAIAASQSFGTGTASAIVVPLVAHLLRPGLGRRPLSALIVWSIPAVVALTASVMFRAQSRFTTRGRVHLALLARAWTGWGFSVPMLWHLAHLGTLPLLLGTLFPLDRYPAALFTAIVISAAVALASALYAGTRRERRSIAALLLLATVTYGTIAAARAGIIAAARPGAMVEAIVAAPRYHYQAQAVLAVLAAIVAGQTMRSRRLGAIARMVLSIWLLVVVGSRIVWPPLPKDLREQRETIRLQRGLVEAEIRSSPGSGAACVPNRPVSISPHVPGAFGTYILFHRADEFEGRRVYFTSANPAVLALRLPGSRAESLLLPDGECPPPPRP